MSSNETLNFRKIDIVFQDMITISIAPMEKYDTDKIIADLHKAIQNYTGRHKALVDRKFHMHDEYLSYGLTASEFRKLMKEFHSQFLQLSFQERMDTASRLLQEHVGELGHVGFCILTLSVKDLEPKQFLYLDSLPEHFRS